MRLYLFVEREFISFSIWKFISGLTRFEFLDFLFRAENHQNCKVGCVSTMVISSEFRMEQNRVDYHLETHPALIRIDFGISRIGERRFKIRRKISEFTLIMIFRISHLKYDILNVILGLGNRSWIILGFQPRNDVFSHNYVQFYEITTVIRVKILL